MEQIMKRQRITGLKIISIIFIALIVSACGGGGGGSTTVDPDPTPAGSSNWNEMVWGKDNWA